MTDIHVGRCCKSASSAVSWLTQPFTSALSTAATAALRNTALTRPCRHWQPGKAAFANSSRSTERSASASAGLEHISLSRIMTRARSSGSRAVSLRMRCSTCTTGGRWAARPAPSSLLRVQNMARLEHFGVQLKLSATSCCSRGAAMRATYALTVDDDGAAAMERATWA